MASYVVIQNVKKQHLKWRFVTSFLDPHSVILSLDSMVNLRCQVLIFKNLSQCQEAGGCREKEGHERGNAWWKWPKFLFCIVKLSESKQNKWLAALTKDSRPVDLRWAWVFVFLASRPEHSDVMIIQLWSRLLQNLRVALIHHNFYEHKWFTGTNQTHIFWLGLVLGFLF